MNLAQPIQLSISIPTAPSHPRINKMTDIKNNVHLISDLMVALESPDTVLVTFTTKAGTQRVMGCTRNLTVVPEELRDDINTPKLNHESIIAVYDFQNSGWRSFRKDAVTKFEVAK